jgi:hypothetical protein
MKVKTHGCFHRILCNGRVIVCSFHERTNRNNERTQKALAVQQNRICIPILLFAFIHCVDVIHYYW